MLLLTDLEHGTDTELVVSDNQDETNKNPIFINIDKSSIGLTKTQTLELIEELKSLIE